MMYDSILTMLVGWYRKVDGLFARLLLLPVVLLLWLLGQLVALPAEGAYRLWQLTKNTL
jgi:hypothetical protein